MGENFKKRARPKNDDANGDDDDDNHDEERVYKFNVLLPNGINVLIRTRNAVGDVPLEFFLAGVRKKAQSETSNSNSNTKHRREIFWDSKQLYLEDASGNKVGSKLCLDHFKPNKLHYLRLFDGADKNADTFENMWDLTPDTDLLAELPDDYTFETALADLIDNSLQAVWANGHGERKLISVVVKDDRVSIYDTGPGMDATEENSIAKWGKVGASLHRSVKKLAVGGAPPYLTPYFGMFGYGGTFAAMHLGRYAIVSAKTKQSKKVYWLCLERDALLRRSGSSSKQSWKVAGGIHDPSVDEIEESPHGSFTKVELKPKLKLPNIFQLQCKLKDIYFPYIQCDEISKAGKTATPVEFEVNGINLAGVDGGEFAVTNLHSCNGPDFILNLHFCIEDDKTTERCPGTQVPREANARLKCVYFPIVKGKENIERILDKLKADGCGIKEDFENFSRISIRRLGRLLPDARWETLPFMRSKQKGGDRVQMLRSCCLRVKCFIDTDAGFHPIPSKTDLASHHPFTKALKDLGSDDPALKDKEVKIEIYRDGKRLTIAQLLKAYQDWVLEMHTQYDEEFNCGDYEFVLPLNASNKDALGIKSDVVRVHRAISRKGVSWKSGQRVKIRKGACPGCHKSNMYVTLEYFLIGGFEGDAGGEARVICRPMGVRKEDGCILTVDPAEVRLELHSSKSLPIIAIDPGKCVAVDTDDWNRQVDKLNLRKPSRIEMLGISQCKELGIDRALPTNTVSAGFEPPKELAAVLRPLDFTSSCTDNHLDKKYIIKNDAEMFMDIKFKAEATEASQLEHYFSGSVTPTSRKGVHGLYIFQLDSVSHLFQKAGIYTFSFSIKKPACLSCEISVYVKASSRIKHWELSEESQHLQFNTSVGFPPFSVARYDAYGNCIPFETTPEFVFQLKSNDDVLCHMNKAKLELSSNKLNVVVTNLSIITNSLDKIRPSYKATLVLSQPDEQLILSIPCQVEPGPLKSVTLHWPQSVKSLLPNQVLEDIKLEMFDRLGNHVKEGTEVELKVHGLSFLDQDAKKRKVDHLGFINLSGLMKVTRWNGTHVSLSVISAKEVIYTTKFQVEKRKLRLSSNVPKLCPAESTLKDIAFEVVDSKGDVDQSIHEHDDDKLGESHMLNINLPDFDDKSPSTGSRIASTRPSMKWKNVATPERTPSKKYDFNDKHGAKLYQSTGVNSISSTPFTPERLMALSGPDFQDVEKELEQHGLHIKEYEEDLAWLGNHKDITVKELLQLQDSANLLQLDQPIGMPYKEIVFEAIQRKVDSAACVYSLVSRNISLQNRHVNFMSDLIGVVALIGSTPSLTLSRLLSNYLGEGQMLTIVCRSSVRITTLEEYEHEINSIAADLGKCIRNNHLIYLEDIRAYSGCVMKDDPQRRLVLPDPTLPDGKLAPGFLGYAVNMIDIDLDLLQVKTTSGYGLRETLLYRLFGELQVYETKEHMIQAYGCIRNGALSLDGGLIHNNGIISLGLKKVDIHFPVMVGVKQEADITQLIEEKKQDLRTARKAIAVVSSRWRKCKKNLEERHVEYQKLIIEERESSLKKMLSQQSLNFSPMPSQNSGQ